MTEAITQNQLSQKQLAQQYFAEARGWDADISVRIKQSEKRAWRCCILFTIIAVLQGIGLVCLLPLKTIEPFVIRVDNNTGLVDVVSTLASHGEIKLQVQELMDKYWLLHQVQYHSHDITQLPLKITLPHSCRND